MVGASAVVLGAVLAYAVVRERAEQRPNGEASGSAASSVAPSAPSEPGKRQAPSPADPTARQLLEEACKDDRRSCACHRAAIDRAFSLLLQDAAQEILDGAPADCVREFTSSGLQAEVLARSGKLAEARQEAEALLLEQPNNAHAAYALALVWFSHGEIQQSRAAAQRALESGRGAPAHTLLGLLAFREDQLDAAAGHLDAAIAQDPRDLETVFNRAVLLEKQRRYNLAREGYLKALALRPGHADSRYALARMTHAAGASDEARHHLRKLTEIAPHDERIPALQQQLAGQGPSATVLKSESAAGE